MTVCGICYRRIWCPPWLLECHVNGTRVHARCRMRWLRAEGTRVGMSSRSADLGDDPDGDIEGYDGGYTLDADR